MGRHTTLPPFLHILYIGAEPMVVLCVLSDYNLENDDLSLEGLFGRGTSIAYIELSTKVQ